MTTYAISNRKKLGFAAAALLAIPVALVCATPAHAATATVNTAVKQGTSTAYKQVAQGKTCGTASASGKAITGIKVSKQGKLAGNVSYQMYAGKWVSGKNGKAVANGSQAARILKVSLTGKLKKTYDVAYRAYVPGYGWLGWASNGSAAGTSDTSASMSAVQVKLVKKGTKLSNTGSAYVDASFLKLTGNLNADEKCVAMAKKGGTLEGAFKSFVGSMRYVATGRDSLAVGSYPASRLKTEGVAAFTKGQGDCYTFTAGTYYLATYLGYAATPVSGQAENLYGKVSAFSWCEVVVDGETQIWDADDQCVIDKDFSGKVTARKRAVDENGNYIKGDDGNYVLEKGADGKDAYFEFTPKFYGITYEYVANHPENIYTVPAYIK